MAPTLTPKPLRLSPEALAQLFEGIELTQADMQRAVAVGLIRFDGADIVVSNAVFADVGPSVARLGVPVGETLDEYEALRGAVDDIAERFHDVFERNIWQPFVAEGMSPERVPQITSDVSRLASLATSVVTSELHERFATYAADYMTRATEQRSRES